MGFRVRGSLTRPAPAQGLGTALDTKGVSGALTFSHHVLPQTHLGTGGRGRVGAERAGCDRGGCGRRAGGHWGDAGGTGHWPAGRGHRGGGHAGVSTGGSGGGSQHVAVLQRGVLGCELQLDEHHMVTNAQRQGQRRAARQEVTDLQRAARQPRAPACGAPSPARPGPPRCVTWGLSPPLSGLWGPCRCHGCLNKMNRYFRKLPPPARPGLGAAGGCGGTEAGETGAWPALASLVLSRRNRGQRGRGPASNHCSQRTLTSHLFPTLSCL